MDTIKVSIIDNIPINPTIKKVAEAVDIKINSTIAAYNEEDRTIKTRINSNGVNISVEPFHVIENSGQYETYKDSYSIEPYLKTKTTLETKNKVMTENLTIKEVPRYYTSNEAGGITVYIGRKTQ